MRNKFFSKKYWVAFGIAIVLISTLSYVIYNSTKPRKAKGAKYYKKEKQSIVSIISNKIKNAQERTKVIKQEKERSKITKYEREINKYKKDINMKNAEIKRYKSDIEKLQNRTKKQLVKIEMEIQKERNIFLKKEKEAKNKEIELQNIIKKLQEEKISKEGKASKDVEQVSDEKVYKLIKTYENMPPEQVADIFLNMEDDELLAKIINRMKESSLGRILAEMDPKKAVNISKMVARPKMKKTEVVEEEKIIPLPEVVQEVR